MSAIFGGGDNKPQREFGVRVNQSIYGYPIPVVMGTGQVQQSVFWGDGFSSKKESAGGGKGGGGKGGSEYDYSIDLVAGICNGPITAIGDVWSGQSWLGNPKSTESYTISGAGTYTPTFANALQQDLGVSFNTTYSGTYNDFGAPTSTVLSGGDLSVLKAVAYGTSLTTGLYSVNPATGVYNFNSTTDAGKTVQLAYSYSLTTINQQETDLVPAGKTISVGGSNKFSTDFGVVYTLTNVALTKVSGTPSATGTYSVSGSGPATYKFATGDINAEVTITYSVQDPNAVGQGQPTILNYTLNVGTQGQSPYSFLTSTYPGAAFGYTSVATVLYQPMDLGFSAEIQQNKFEVITADMFGGGIQDCNPVQCLGQVLTNSVWGLGVGTVPFPSACIDNGASGTWGAPTATGGTRTTASTAYAWCAANGFFMSPVIDSQDTAASVASPWLEAAQVSAFMSEGLLKLVPYGDTTTAGNGYTWQAPSNFIVALDDSCVIAEDGEDPFKITRSPAHDAWNTVQVQWDNRAFQYSPEITQESDQASINRWGERREDPQDWDFIHTITAATFAANMRVKRSVYIRNTFEFTLPYSYSYLEPMDIVTISTTSVWAKGLNNANLGITNLPVRITKIVDDPKTGLHTTAEDYPFGAHQPVLYNKQLAAGDVVANAFADPGNSEVVLFEATNRLTLYEGDQIWIGALGTSDTWGSTNILVSSDSGVTYLQVGTINAPARIGEIHSTFATGSDPDTTHSLVVDLVENCNAWDSGSTSDADNGNTLVFVDGEIISYSTLATTGQNQITMSSYIRRGQMGSTISSHSAGGLVMRLDNAVFKYTYDPTWRGKTLLFKFQSVNSFGNNAQELSGLTPVSFTIPGDNPGSIDASTGLVVNIGDQIFLGAWSSAVTYASGVFVDSGGIIYVSLQDSNTNHTPASSPTWWLTAGSVAWQGTWSSSTTYKVGDLVSYLSLVYVSLIASNLNHIPSSSPTDWQLTGTASQFLGNWSSSTAYVVGAQVIDVAGGGGYYIAIANSTNVQPSTNGTDWALIVPGNLNSYAGNYSGATAYGTGDIVEYQGSQWVCISATTGNAPSTTSSFWTLLGSNALFMGTWSSSVAYTQNMIVVFGGNLYQAVTASTNVTPSQTATTPWILTGPSSLDSLEDGTIFIKGIQYQSQTIVVPNSNFEASSSLPVPGWTGSSATLAYETSTPYAGNQSLKVTTSAQFGAAISNQKWSCSPGDLFFVSAAMKSDGTGTPEAQLAFLDKTGAYLSGVQVAATTGTSWVIYSGSGSAPANSVSCELLLQNNTVSGSGVCWFDSIYAVKALDMSTQLVPKGSNPPTQNNGFSYTSTTTSIDLVWTSQMIYRNDGTIVTVGSGSQNVTGLGTNEVYYAYPYYDEPTGVLAWVNTSSFPNFTGATFASGSAQEITTTTQAALGSNFSLEFWIKVASGYSGAGGMVKAAVQTGTISSINTVAGMGFNSGAFSAFHRDTGATVHTLASTTTAVNDGQWHHVVYSVQSTVAHNLYIDGIQVSTAALGTLVSTTATDWWRLVKDSSNASLTGTMSEVAVYSTALSAAQAYSHFTAGNSGSQTAYETVVTADAPIYWWKLKETSGTSAADSAGTNTGTYVNSPTLNQTSAIFGPLGSPAILWSAQTVLAAQAQMLSTRVPLTAGGWAVATTATGTGGGGTSGSGGGGGKGCFSGNVKVKTAHAGFVEFAKLPATVWLQNETGVHLADLLVHEGEWQMLDMGGKELVTLDHLMKDGGNWTPAREYFVSHPTSRYTGKVYNLHVRTERPEDQHYILENGCVAHNTKVV